MSNFYNINGNIIPREEAKIYPTDLGLRRGFAAFDYLRVFKGKPLFLDDHLDRFANSARILGLELPFSKEELKTQILQLVAKNNLAEIGLQLFLTGGYSDDGFTPTKPNLIMLARSATEHHPDAYEKGVKLISHSYQRDFPEAKTNNYLMAVYLSKAIEQAGAKDVLYHHNGKLLEAAVSNIFLVTPNDILVTPNKNILKGTTRKHILHLARQHFKVEEREVLFSELADAKEVFITSVTKGAMPVCGIGDDIVGNGKPGKVVQHLIELFAQHVTAYLKSK